jgi:hypothetical protein
VRDFERAIVLIRARARDIPTAFVLLVTQVYVQVFIPYTFLTVILLNQHQTVDYWTNFWLVAVAFPIFGIVNIMPIGIPGMLGILDTAMAGTFIVLGFAPELALLTTLLTRGVILVFELILTGSVAIFSGYSRYVKKRAALSETAIASKPGVLPAPL